MSDLALVGHTACDRVNGGATTTGGAPHYGLLGLAELGATATVVTSVAAGEEALLEPLQERADELVWWPASQTASYELSQGESSETRRVVVEALGEPWSAATVEEQVLPALATSKVVHAGALNAADFPAESLELLGRGRRLSLDAHGLVRPARIGPVALEPTGSLEVLEHVDVLKLSLEEADAMDVEPTALSLGSLGISEVVLTAGGRGAWIYVGGALVEIASEPVDARDTTGAGDAFIACYLRARLDGAGGANAGTVAAGAVAAMLRRRHQTER